MAEPESYPVPMTGSAPLVTECIDLTDGVRLVVSGEVDLASATDLRDSLGAAVGGGHDVVELDLSGVTFMDSQGLRALLEVWPASGASKHLGLVDASPPVRRVLDATGLAGHFGLRSDD